MLAEAPALRAATSSGLRDPPGLRDLPGLKELLWIEMRFRRFARLRRLTPTRKLQGCVVVLLPVNRRAPRGSCPAEGDTSGQVRASGTVTLTVAPLLASRPGAPRQHHRARSITREDQQRESLVSQNALVASDPGLISDSPAGFQLNPELSASADKSVPTCENKLWPISL